MKAVLVIRAKMNNSELKVLKHFKNNECCIFCKTNLIDPTLYGTIYKYGGIITHYFCLLLSPNIIQKGSDQYGILGFLSKDIKEEVSRGRRLLCTYCGKHGATIGCAVKACKIMFHLSCGIANDAQNLFYDNFSSFCSKHRSLQYIPLSKRNAIENTACLICLDSLSLSFTETVWASCCKTAFYHKRCIQNVAINSGYCFRCPNCNDDKLFRRQMLNSGIYIPDQDASWEFEPDAFSGLNERYSRCDATVCRCPRGRDICHSNGYWQIILCFRCLSQGIHRKCGRGFIFNEQWACSSPSCLNESTVETTNTNKLYFRTMPQCSSGKMMSNLQLLACKSTENKENSDLNSSNSGLNICKNRKSNAQHNLNMLNSSERLFMGRKSMGNGNSSFMAGTTAQCCIVCNSASNCCYLGKLHVLEEVYIHTNCLIFSPGIYRTKKKSEGLFGFEKTIIANELNRCKKQICAFCKNIGATVSCSAKNCQVAFHLNCAILKNSTVHLNLERYTPKSYCEKHIPKCIVDGEPIVGIILEAKLCQCCQLPLYHEYCKKNVYDISSSWSKCQNCKTNSERTEKFMKNLNVSISNKNAFLNCEDLKHRNCSPTECLWRKRKKEGCHADDGFLPFFIPLDSSVLKNVPN